MSIELDTVLQEVTRPPTESCEERGKRPNSEPEKEPKQLKSEPEIGSEQEQEPKSTCDCGADDEDEDPELSYLMSQYDEDIVPYFYICDKYCYKNKVLKEIEKADDEYREQSLKLSVYDAIPRPRNSMLIGGVGVVPFNITDNYRIRFNDLSKFALNDYNTKKAPTFVFHHVVKCTYDVYAIDGMMYYITFQAKAEEDPSDSPAVTTFQAQVWVDDDRDKSPDVLECAIKI